MRGMMLGLAVLLVASASFVGCNQELQPTPMQRETPEAQPSPAAPTATPKPSPSPTATVKPGEERQVLAGGEGWAFYEGDVPPFEANQKAWGIGQIGLITSADKYDMDAGESVKIRFTARNHTGKTVIIEPKEGPAMDIWVSYHRASVRLDEYWSDDREIPDEIRRLELLPGESRTLEWTWTSLERRYGSAVGVDGILYHPMQEVGVGIYVCVEHGCAEE